MTDKKEKGEPDYKLPDFWEVIGFTAAFLVAGMLLAAILRQ